jgi:predicted dehydrogenase
MDITVKVAVVGAGAVAKKFHLPCYRKNRFSRIEAVVDVDAKRAKNVARRFRVKNWYSSFQELLDSKKDIDAISICTPPNFHSADAVAALDRGISVLCEKPLASTLSDGQKILDSVRKSTASFMMGFNRRFNPNYQHTKYLASMGKMGRIYFTEYRSLQQSPLVGWSKADWFYSETDGGCLRDQGPHVFDILNWFLGKPMSVYAKKFTNLETTVDESCFATVRYDSGNIGIGVMSWLSPDKIEQLQVLGTSANVIATPEILLELKGGTLPDIALMKASSPMYMARLKNVLGIEKSSTFQSEINYFISCITKGRKPALTIQDGFQALALTCAAKRSLQQGKEVAVFE